MKILYYCHNCGDFIDELTVEQVNDEKLGFDLLTEDEKQDIIKWSKSGNMLYVGSVCDNCYQEINTMTGGTDPYFEEHAGLFSTYDYPRMH